MNQSGGQFDINDAFFTESELSFPNSPVYYDNQSLLEHYNVASARIWREEYKVQYTDMFISKGIEIFR